MLLIESGGGFSVLLVCWVARGFDKGCSFGGREWKGAALWIISEKGKFEAKWLCVLKVFVKGFNFQIQLNLDLFLTRFCSAIVVLFWGFE